MELLLLALLIAPALLGGLTLGSIGFFKSLGLKQQVRCMDAEVERLSVEVEGLRTMCLRLMRDKDPKDTSASIATTKPATPTTSTLPPTHPKRNPSKAARTDEANNTAHNASIEEPETSETLTTLERLREGRKSQSPNARAQDVAQDISQDVLRVSVPTAAPTGTSTSTPTHSQTPQSTPQAIPTAPARRLSIEEVLAGKVFIWIGAIALVLTGTFLLKIGFSEGIVTREMCVVSASLLGLTMWGAGEWMRCRVILIAQALCGASVAVLYGSIIAADHYRLLGSGFSLFGFEVGIAFGLMAIVTIAAVVMSLRHGPAVAILGMLGGFMMPPFLTSDTSPTLGMVLYLIVIEVGVLTVTGKRGWFGISLMTLIFSALWSLGYTLIGDTPQERTLTAFLVLGTAGAYLLHTAGIHRDPAATHSMRKRAIGLSVAATCSAIGIVALLVVQGNYTPRDLSTLGLVALGTLVLARLDARQLAMPFVAMGLSALVLFSNAVSSLPSSPSTTFMATVAGFGALFTLGGYACMWGIPHRRAFAAMSAIAGPAFYSIILFASHEAIGLRDAWWPTTLGLAGAYTLATLAMLWRRKAEHDWSIAWFSVLSFVLLATTLGQALDHPYFAVSLALLSAIAALIDLKLFIRPLQLVGATTAFVSASLLVVPGPFDLTIHGGAVFNTLLPMYLLPAIAFGIIAWASGRAGSSATARNLIWLSIGTIGAMLLVHTRQVYHPTDWTATSFALYEWTSYATVLMLASFVSHWVGHRRRSEPILSATRCMVGTGAVLGLFGGIAPGNPLFHDNVGGGLECSISLLALYIMPATLMWLWSRRTTIQTRTQLANMLRVMSITLIALFIGLQVRNGFAPDALHTRPITMFECASYGLAWILFGTALHFISPSCTLLHSTRATGRVIFGVGLTTLLLGNALIFNPLWVREAVGNLPILNGLWYLYGPAILVLALFARHARRQQCKAPAKLAGFTAIAISFMLLCMLIRHGFAGDGYTLIASNLASSERYAYSLAWVIFGGALLIAGVFTRLDTLRYGSLAILLLAVGKVFLIDTANLDNLYRVFSFFGLGVALIGLGYLYQRLVFKRPDKLNEVPST